MNGEEGEQPEWRYNGVWGVRLLAPVGYYRKPRPGLHAGDERADGAVFVGLAEVWKLPDGQHKEG